MTSNTEFDCYVPSHPTLCIPRVFSNISEKRIREVFNQVELGDISNINMVESCNKQGVKSKLVFIHFTHWFNNPDANETRRRVLKGESVKIIYDNPWFWNISMSHWVDQRKSIYRENTREVKPTLLFETMPPVSIVHLPVPSEEKPDKVQEPSKEDNNNSNQSSLPYYYGDLA